MSFPHTNDFISWHPYETYKQLVWGLGILGLLAIVLAIISQTPGIAGIGCFILAMWVVLFMRRDVVPTNPSHVALMTWYGHISTAGILPPGEYPSFKNVYPIAMGFIPIPSFDRVANFSIGVVTSMRDCDYTNDARDLQASGEARIVVQLVYTPDTSDPLQLLRYLNAGGSTSVDTLGPIYENMQGRISEIVRTAAGMIPWSDLPLRTDLLRALILRSLTGVPIHKYRDDLELSSHPSRDLSSFIVGEWTSRELAAVYSDDSVGAASRDIARYLGTQSSLAGAIDQYGWGIAIRRLNVESVVFVGGLARDAAAAARTQARMRAESMETNKRLRQALDILEASKGVDGAPTISFERALEILRIQAGLSTEEVRKVRLEGDMLTDFAGIVRAIGSREGDR